MNGIEPGGGVSEATELFPYAEDEGISASPSTIADMADTIEASGGSLDAFSTDVDVSHRPAMTGTAGVLQTLTADAPTATKNNVSQVLAATLCASGTTRLFGENGVSAYNGLVDDLRAEYDERKAEIMASDCGVAEVSYPKGTTSSERTQLDSDRADEVATAREEQIAELVVELRERQAEYREDPLDAEADTAAARLEEGPTEEVIKELFTAGALPSTTVDLFPTYDLDEEPLDEWPSDLKDATDEEKAAWLLDHPELGTILAGEASDHVIELMGEGLADQARELDEDSSVKEIEALDEALNAWGLEVNAQFVKALGGDELVQLVTTLGANAYEHNDNTDAAAALAESLQHSAEAASWMLSGDEARTIADDMVDAVEDNESGSTHQSLGLSFLLDGGNFDTEFLDTMGDRLDAYERSADFPETGWRGMGSDPAGVQWFFPEGSRDAAFDPMASYMSALGNNGEASLEFFTEGKDRQEYWIQERFWGHDDFNGLLQALDSATTDDDNLGSKAAGKLVSNAVHLLVTRDENFDDGWFTDSDEMFRPGDIGGIGAESLAHMMGTYMASVDYANTEGGDGVDVHSLDGRPDLALLGLGDNMPIFDNMELKELFQTAVSNEDGFIAMREAVSNYQNYHLSTVLSHHGEPGFYEVIDPETGEAKADGLWPSATNADARLEGLLLDSIGEVEIADGVEKDQQIKAWIALGQRLVDTVPVGKGLEPFTTTATGLAGMGLEEALATEEAKAISSVNDAADLAMDVHKGVLVENLYYAGVVTEEQLRAAAEEIGMSDDEFTTFFPGPDPVFPDPEDLADEDNQKLRDLMNTIANDEIRMGDWRLHYENAFDDYEDELGR